MFNIIDRHNYDLKTLPYRIFKSKFDKILKRIPALGKLLSSLFGIFKLYILELFRRIDKRFNIYTMGIVNKYFLKGRWGGRVVPLNKNLDIDSKFISSQEILEILSRSNVAGISWCYCRSVQRKYEKPNCDHPLFSCIHLSSGKSLYEIPYKSHNLKKVSKKEIIELLEECDKRGLVHQLIYFPNPQFYYLICNCCPCCCVVLNKFLKNGSPQMIKSDFIAKTDLNKCINCGTCEIWCHFGGRLIIKEKLQFNPVRCFGCGICVSKCPNDAISLIQKN
ncbi:MAG: 4Fe-4S binding protein [Candidatus Hodarchaeota archaeon]